MDFIELKESELKQITLFLIEKKVIFHPVISPNGTPDFTSYKGKKFILILDRNLLVRILRLINKGELKDKFSQILIGSLLFWSEINRIAITSGLALTEYSHFHQGNEESSLENNTFVNIFRNYSPKDWLDLALDRRQKIQPIELNEKEEFSFLVESDHFKMHYLEMLKLSQLYYSDQLSIVEKFKKFHECIFDNILICKYTTYFAALALGNRTKMFKNQIESFEELDRKCINQSWDLTYLSFWSTMYYYEDNSNEVYLFATHDKELKTLFMITHEESLEIYKEIFKPKLGDEIIKTISSIYTPRVKPEIDSTKLDKMISMEKEKLKIAING